MTSTTKEIFDRFEIRKSKKQKQAFRDWLIPILQQQGYSVRVEQGSMGSRNIVIGDPEQAEVVFTAHYDTCAVLPVPNFITPKSPALYCLYQLVLVIPMLAVIFAVAALFAWLDEDLFMLGYWVGFLGLMAILLCGPANRHTANDNTSGVTAVVDLAMAMPQALRGKAAFVLFDLEEMGLIGSAAFAKAHKEIRKEKLIVNMDCVSDGETILFVLRKGARPYLERLCKAFPSDSRVTTDFAAKGYVCPSDQANFQKGVGVASMLKTKRGLLYMNKIHTGKDTVYREENVAYLVEGCIRLTEGLAAETE